MRLILPRVLVADTVILRQLYTLADPTVHAQLAMHVGLVKVVNTVGIAVVIAGVVPVDTVVVVLP